MLDFVVIANRGNIAVRAIEACRKAGLPYVAVYEEADKNSMHVARKGKFSERSIRIEGYDVVTEYVSVADHFRKMGYKNVGVYPGTGYWSESSTFEQFCDEYGLTFIGPSHQSLELCGDKIAFRSLCERLGIPVMPGREVESIEDAIALADSIGYPVMVKDAAGAGGVGTEAASGRQELIEKYELVSKNRHRVYLEKKLENFAHIEVQVLGIDDNMGYRVLILGERNCTWQRNNQKVIELCPSEISDSLRKELYGAAYELALQMHYVNAGTVEFLVDLSNGKAYAMEWNPRIQVEHGITEMVTGVDIVLHQFLIAGKEPIILTQGDVNMRGFAIEGRVYAEDPYTFAPFSGLITSAHFPKRSKNLRIDTYLRNGVQRGEGVMVGKYDVNIANVIAWAKEKEGAKSHLMAALSKTSIGCTTNIPYLQRIIPTV